jgi:hypothetical protein
MHTFWRYAFIFCAGFVAGKLIYLVEKVWGR